MLFGQVKGPDHQGRPRKIRNDTGLSDFQHLQINCPRRSEQASLARQDLGHTHPAHVLDSVNSCCYYSDYDYCY